MSAADATPYDLELALPADRDPADYAIDLLRSTHLDDVQAAEHWLRTHPDRAGPALVQALDTPSAQAAAVLLGQIGNPAYVPDLVAAYEGSGIGMQSAVQAGLAMIDGPEARAALVALTE